MRSGLECDAQQLKPSSLWRSRCAHDPVRQVSSITFRACGADRSLVTQLIETRWKRYGKDRIYVKTVEGNDIGHVDLVERTVVAKIADNEAELRECLVR